MAFQCGEHHIGSTINNNLSYSNALTGHNIGSSCQSLSKSCKYTKAFTKYLVDTLLRKSNFGHCFLLENEMLLFKYICVCVFGQYTSIKRKNMTHRNQSNH